MSEEPNKYQGSCYCGAVSITVEDQPMVAGYCHCQSCRKWHSTPLIAWAAWPTANVQISGDTVTSTHSSESHRISCAECGSNLANKKPTKDITAVYPMSLIGSDFKFVPAFHLFYEERVMDIADGLPKFVDASKEVGFSGEMAGEPETTGWLTSK